jgi:hypothetical protein
MRSVRRQQYTSHWMLPTNAKPCQRTVKKQRGPLAQRNTKNRLSRWNANNGAALRNAAPRIPTGLRTSVAN